MKRCHHEGCTDSICFTNLVLSECLLLVYNQTDQRELTLKTAGTIDLANLSKPLRLFGGLSQVYGKMKISKHLEPFELDSLFLKCVFC